MKIKSLLVILVAICGFFFFYENTNAPTQPEPVPGIPTTEPQTKDPTPYTLGENDTYALSIADETLLQSVNPIDITVTDKTSNETFTLPGISGVGTPGYVTNNTSKTLLLLSLGTSHIRQAKIFDLKEKKELMSFCHMGTPVFWRNYFIYEDCTTSTHLQNKSGVVENGEYAPVIYKLDPLTGVKTVLIASDDLHIYSVDINRTYTDTDPNFILHVTSVAKLADWTDFTKWKEGEKVFKIQ